MGYSVETVYTYASGRTKERNYATYSALALPLTGPRYQMDRGYVYCYSLSIPIRKEVYNLVLFFLRFSYALMLHCWEENPEERPSFEDLFERLDAMLLQEVEYFSLAVKD